jgi:hypothetical protein
MWQEMRKHEKKLRGMIVDYKRRSERRKEYYERIVRKDSFRIYSIFSVFFYRNVIQLNSYKFGVDQLKFI